MPTQVKDYTYNFPEELIALYPQDRRDGSRLMILNRQDQSIQHRIFSDIINEFEAGDVLVLNNTKVFPCRLLTERKTGGKQEIFLLNEYSKNEWNVLINNSKKVRAGDEFEFENLKITILDDEGSERQAKLEYNGSLPEILQKIAKVPLPPYIKREADETDLETYQTVYAKYSGSVAAPTAGLHFTEELFEKLRNKGVKICFVTLHVGLGTFLPVKTENIEDHKMHSERFSISQETCDTINEAKANSKKITAVGTTSARVLESLAKDNPRLKETHGETEIFIYPPYEFQCVDRLITNFHQPESTLIMMVSAFAGRDFILSSYELAIKEHYRLFSYGDAMLIK